jgi:hypothetical protein
MNYPASPFGYYYAYKIFNIVVSLEKEDGTKIKNIRYFADKNIPIVVTEGNRIAIELFITNENATDDAATNEEIKEQGISLLKNFVIAFNELLTSTESVKIETIKDDVKGYLMSIFKAVPRYELCLYQYSAFGDEIVNAYLRGYLFSLNANGVKTLNDIITRWKSSGKIFPLTAQLHALGFVHPAKPLEITSTRVGDWLENPRNDDVSRLYGSGSKLFTDEQIEEACRLFVEDLNTIIQGAPKLPFDYVVFRGLLGYLPDVNGSWKAGFLSTSISSYVSKTFTYGMCCFMIINVPKGTPFLLIPQKYSYYTQEVEVLFPPNTQLTLTNDSLSYKDINSFMYDMKSPVGMGGRRRRQTRKRKGRSRKYRK